MRNPNDITIVGSLKNYHIPYGICEIMNGGDTSEDHGEAGIQLPGQHGHVRTPGRRHSTSFPKIELFHMTQLIEKVKDDGGKVAVFPVSDKAWLDTGEWAEYRKALKQFEVDT